MSSPSVNSPLIGNASELRSLPQTRYEQTAAKYSGVMSKIGELTGKVYPSSTRIMPLRNLQMKVAIVDDRISLKSVDPNAKPNVRYEYSGKKMTADQVAKAMQDILNVSRNCKPAVDNFKAKVSEARAAGNDANRAAHGAAQRLMQTAVEEQKGDSQIMRRAATFAIYAAAGAAMGAVIGGGAGLGIGSIPGAIFGLGVGLFLAWCSDQAKDVDSTRPTIDPATNNGASHLGVNMTHNAADYSPIMSPLPSLDLDRMDIGVSP